MGLCRVQRLGPQPQFRTSLRSHPRPRAPQEGRLRPPFNCMWSASLPAQACSVHPFTSVVPQSTPYPQMNLLFANLSVLEPVSQELTQDMGPRLSAPIHVKPRISLQRLKKALAMAAAGPPAPPGLPSHSQAYIQAPPSSGRCDYKALLQVERPKL